MSAKSLVFRASKSLSVPPARLLYLLSSETRRIYSHL